MTGTARSIELDPPLSTKCDSTLTRLGTCMGKVRAGFVMLQLQTDTIPGLWWFPR